MTIVNSAGTIIDEGAFRAMNPLVSFPAFLSEADVSPFGMSILATVSQPPAHPFYTVSQGAPSQVDGVWTQTWVQTPVSLSDAQNSQSNLLDSACAQSIVSGFTSSALGSSHTYPSSMTDQQNLTACIVASMYPGLDASWTTQFWCADSSGTWAWTAHTAAQIQQVGLDGKAAVMAYQTQNAQLQAQVKDAATVDAVAAITWPT